MASRWNCTVIHIVSHTHTYTYLQGMNIFLFLSRKNHRLYDRADSNCHSQILLILCQLDSLHVIFLSYYYYQERTQPKWKKLLFFPFTTRIGTNFRMFTFIHIRQYILHSETRALDPMKWTWQLDRKQLFWIRHPLTVDNIDHRHLVEIQFYDTI